MVEAFGYRRDDGSAVCVDCATLDDPDGSVIGDHTTGDRPTHCLRCRALIPHRLTDAGRHFVSEAIKEALLSPNRPEPEVIWWCVEYGPHEYRYAPEPNPYNILVSVLEAKAL